MSDERDQENVAATENAEVAEDVEAHGIEVEDDTEAAILNVNVNA
jgi:hypothetical protein